jgi:hypothetical protein
VKLFSLELEGAGNRHHVIDIWSSAIDALRPQKARARRHAERRATGQRLEELPTTQRRREDVMMATVAPDDGLLTTADQGRCERVKPHIFSFWWGQGVSSRLLREALRSGGDTCSRVLEAGVVHMSRRQQRPGMTLCQVNISNMGVFSYFPERGRESIVPSIVGCPLLEPSAVVLCQCQPTPPRRDRFSRHLKRSLNKGEWSDAQNLSDSYGKPTVMGIFCAEAY